MKTKLGGWAIQQIQLALQERLDMARTKADEEKDDAMVDYWVETADGCASALSWLFENLEELYK